MSFDEKQYLDNDEIDLSSSIRSIWFYKFSLLIFVLSSIPLSVWFSTNLEPTYKAETVFEKPSTKSTQSNTSLLNGVLGSGVAGMLSSGFVGGGSDSFFSEIRSESFLKTVILNNAKLDSQIQEFCPLPSKETSRFTLRSLLISLGISENKTPSERQKISLIVECVNDMLAIDLDTYSANESSAYRLSIESKDADFSANLANEIVEKYFVRHEMKRDQDFQNVKKYLSKVITEAQLEFTEANKLMQSFILKHTLLMNIQPIASAPNVNNNGIGLPLPPSPFAAKLNKEVFNLGQLESSISRLNKAKSTLSNLKQLDQNEIEKAISSTDIQEALSRTFVTSLAKIDNLSVGTSFKNQEIKKIVSQEFERLKQQTQVLQEKIGKREEQTMKLMSIENRFQELAIDVSKKKLIFEALKDQLREKILRTGLANVKQPVLLTKAVPPFSKASPNKKLIVALGVVLFIFLGVGSILIRQFSLRRIHSLSQLKKLSRFLSCYEIKLNQLKKLEEGSDETVISQSFFSNTIGMGKLGCIIDLSQKRLNNSIASDFSKTVASLLATNSSKIACLNTSPIKNPSSISLLKNFVSGNSDHNAQRSLRKSIVTVNNEDDLIRAGEINRIKDKYSDYDNIICNLGAGIADLTKFKFIEQCNFYILIGRSFQFDEYTYKKFSNTVWEKEKKCLGFFLIN